MTILQIVPLLGVSQVFTLQGKIQVSLSFVKFEKEDGEKESRITLPVGAFSAYISLGSGTCGS